MALESESPTEISTEFIEENKKIKFKNSKRGGRYSKEEKNKRQNEVYRLHFDYGYSGRKISEVMKISRNTVNNDINYWHARILRKTNIMNPDDTIIANIQRLEIQRTRLREQLDKTKSFQERMSVERMIYEIDNRILHTCSRLAESTRRLIDFSTEWLNERMKHHESKERFLSSFEERSVSNKAYEKISKIIKQDRESLRHI